MAGIGPEPFPAEQSHCLGVEGPKGLGLTKLGPLISLLKLNLPKPYLRALLKHLSHPVERLGRGIHLVIVLSFRK